MVPRVAIAVAVLLLAGCGFATSTSPPRLEAIKGLLEPGGVSMELVDPSRLAGLPVSRDAAEVIARKEHTIRGPGEPEPPIGHIETWAATVTVQPRPLQQIAGGTHTAWLVALVLPDNIGSELVIVDATTGAVVRTDSSPAGMESLPGDWETTGPSSS